MTRFVSTRRLPPRPPGRWCPKGRAVHSQIPRLVAATAESLGWTQGSSATAVSFATGALAGIAGTVASYPFDLLRTTLAAQGEPKVYRGMVDAARGIVKRSGPRGLYRGLGVTIVEIIPYAALQFGLYDFFNREASRLRGRTESSVGVANGGALQQFLCGLAAGTISKVRRKNKSFCLSNPYPNIMDIAPYRFMNSLPGSMNVHSGLVLSRQTRHGAIAARVWSA